MSIESCVNFLHEASVSDKIKQQMKATTDTQEIIVLGKKHGYTFDVPDLMAAANSLNGGNGNGNGSHPTSPQSQSTTATGSAFYHYEFDMEQIPGFEEI